MNHYDDLEELHDAELFNFHLTLKMLSAIMVARNEEYHYSLHAIKCQLKAKLLNIRHLRYTADHPRIGAIQLGPSVHPV